MRSPGITTLKSVQHTIDTTSTNLNNQWVPARPIGYRSFWYRLKATWLVFTGRCDALQWPEGQ